MVTRTTQDLAKRAMQLLALLEAQEEVAAEDFATIQTTYENRHADLTFRNLAWWPVDEIPLEAFEWIARIIAEEIAPSFGKATPVEIDENSQQVSMGTRGLRGLRRIIQRDPTGLPTQALYF